MTVANDDDEKKQHLEMVCKIVTLGDAVAPVNAVQCKLDGGFRARETTNRQRDMI